MFLQAGVQVGRCELMDDTMIRIMNLETDGNETEAPTLLYELTGSEKGIEEQAQTVRSIVEARGGYALKVSTDRAVSNATVVLFSDLQESRRVKKCGEFAKKRCGMRWHSILTIRP